MDKVKDGVKAIITYQKKFLLVLRDEKAQRFPLHWHFPGGGIEDGETPLETVKREMEEELCLETNDYKFIKVVPGSRGEKLYLYSLQISEQDKDRLRIGNEGREFKFLTLKEMTSLKLTDHTKKFIVDEREMLDLMIDN